VQLGAFLDAEDSLRIAVDECRRVEHRRMEGYARANLGHVLEHLGRHSEARSEIQIARAIATETNEKRLELYARLYELRLDTANVAPHIVERARAIASEAQATSNSAIVSLALMIAASAELTAGRLDSAEALSRESFIVLERNGALSEGEGEVFVTRARCLAACGEDAEALLIWNRGRAAVIAKAERIRDPEMSRRFLTDVPAHRLLMTMLPNGERAPLDPAQA
jgi:hypothetical protein